MCEQWLDDRIEEIRNEFDRDDTSFRHAVTLTAKAETFSRIKNDTILFGSSPREALSNRENLPQEKYMDLNPVRVEALREWIAHTESCGDDR